MKLKVLLAGLLSLTIGAISPIVVNAQTLDSDGNVALPLSPSTIAAPQTLVYQVTSETLTSGGDNFSVGDMVYDSLSGTVFKVTSLASVTNTTPNGTQYGPIGTMDVMYYGATKTLAVGTISDLVPMVTASSNEMSSWGSTPLHRITNGKVKINSSETVNIGQYPRTLQSHMSDEYNPRDYGVKLDGSQDDLTAFARFYAILPDRSVIKFPCDSILPPWPSHPAQHVGFHQGNKNVTWDLRCVGQWGAGAGLDNDVGDQDLVKMSVLGGEWWRRNNASAADWGPILNTTLNYREGSAGQYASGEFSQQSSVAFNTTAFRNAQSTVQTVLINPQDYIQAKWDDQNTGLMEYAAMHNDSSFWPFVFQMTDTSGAQARGWTLTNEYDVGGDGRDFGTDWRRPDDETYAIEPYYAPMDSARKVIAFLPGSTIPDNSSEWQPLHYYHAGDRVYTPNNDSILVAKTSGYSGAYEPTLDGIQPLDEGTSVHTYEGQESGDLSKIPTAVPHDVYITVGNVFKLKATDGNSYYYYLSTTPGPWDPNQINQTMGAFSGGQTPVDTLMSQLKPYTVFTPHDNVTSPSCSDVYTCLYGFTFIPIDPATITAVTAAYNGGTNSQMVTWDRVNTRTEEIGLGIDFQGEYGTPYGRYHNFDPIWVTPISGQARLINAFLDASWMIDWAKNTATIRMHAGQKLDFDADGTEAGKNRRTLSYSTSDGAMEIRQSDGSSDPTAYTDSPLFIFDDWGTLHMDTAKGLNIGVVRAAIGRNNANTFSFSFSDGPVIHAWIDATDMGIIPHYDDTAPSSSTASCNTGEEVDTDAKYYYKCVAQNTWKRIPWDTTSW